MNNKGFLNILLAGIVIVALAGAGYWYWQNGQENSDASKDTPTPTETITKAPTTIPTRYPTPDPTTGWLSYTNEEYGFSFEYPGWLWSEEQVENSIAIPKVQSWQQLPLVAEGERNTDYMAISVGNPLYNMDTIEESLEYIQSIEDTDTWLNDSLVSNVSTQIEDGKIMQMRYELRPVSADWPLYHVSYVFPNYDKNYEVGIGIFYEDENSEIFQRVIKSLSFN